MLSSIASSSQIQSQFQTFCSKTFIILQAVQSNQIATCQYCPVLQKTISHSFGI